jgi:hypothetical protein
MERLSVQLVRTFERLLSERGTVGTAPLVEQLLDCTVKAVGAAGEDLQEAPERERHGRHSSAGRSIARLHWY